MNKNLNKSIFLMGMWLSLDQPQDPARNPAAMTGEVGVALSSLRQCDLKTMAATLKESQQVTSGRFKIDAILLHHCSC